MGEPSGARHANDMALMDPFGFSFGGIMRQMVQCFKITIFI